MASSLRRRAAVLARDTPRLLTTNEVAALLGVHPKHVYRLLKRGLPARRVGDEWRFEASEVLAWTRDETREEAPADKSLPPPLLAANGDLAIEALLETCRERSGPTLGLVLSDHATGLERLGTGSILGAGCHGHAPMSFDRDKLVWLHLTERELGFAHRPGLRFRGLSSLRRYTFASRPSTAGIRRHFDQAWQREGIEWNTVGATEYASHRDAVMAVVRGSADIALASHAWARYSGLGFTPLVVESYGLVFCAKHLADPRVVQICELAQSGAFRVRVREFAGYEPRRAGLLMIGARVSDDASEGSFS